MIENCDYLNTAQAAKILKCHRHTVTNLLVKGTIAGEKKGRQWKVLLSSIEDFINVHGLYSEAKNCNDK